MAFVVTIANFIGGVLSVLFGISLSGPANDSSGSSADFRRAKDGYDPTTPAPEKPAASSGGSGGGGGSKAADPYVAAIKAQTDAIDDQIAALTKLDNVEKAEQKEADLQKAIADAQSQLADLQQSAVNTYGLSSAEQIKAQQKRAADILAAQAKIVTTETSLADWKKSQDTAAQKAALEDEKKALAEQLAAHQANNAGIGGGVKGLVPPIAGLNTDISGLGITVKDFSKQAQDALAHGRGLSDWIKKNLIPGLQDFVGGVMDLVGAIVGFASNTTVQWFVDVFFKGVANGIDGTLAPARLFLGALQGIADWMYDNIPGLKRPAIKASGGAAGQIFGSDPSKKYLPVNYAGFADGGVVDRPTLAMIGEGGEREFVIPESKMPSFAAANSRSGGWSPTPIHLHLFMDGREVTKIVTEQQSRNMPAIGMLSFSRPS